MFIALNFPGSILSVAPMSSVVSYGRVGDVVLVSVEGGGVQLLVPSLDSAGKVIDGSYRPAQVLFDGFNFVEASVNEAGQIVLKDNEFGTYVSSLFSPLEQNISELGEEHFEFVSE